MVSTIFSDPFWHPTLMIAAHDNYLAGCILRGLISATSSLINFFTGFRFLGYVFYTRTLPEDQRWIPEGQYLYRPSESPWPKVTAPNASSTVEPTVSDTASTVAPKSNREKISRHNSSRQFFDLFAFIIAPQHRIDFISGANVCFIPNNLPITAAGAVQ